MKPEIKVYHRKKSTEQQVEMVEEQRVSAEGSVVVTDLKLPEEQLTKDDIRALKALAIDFERTLDYYHLRNHPWRNIVLGLVNGMARGLGFAVGLTVLAFILVSIIQSLNLLNIPIIGDFLADLLEYIDGVRGL